MSDYISSYLSNTQNKRSLIDVLDLMSKGNLSKFEDLQKIDKRYVHC